MKSACVAALTAWSLVSFAAAAPAQEAALPTPGIIEITVLFPAGSSADSSGSSGSSAAPEKVTVRDVLADRMAKDPTIVGAKIDGKVVDVHTPFVRTETTTIEPDQSAEPCGSREPAAWYAIYTRSHFENLVADQLAARGFSLFLPERGVWSKRLQTPRVVPMFPGYLFVRHTLDKASYIEILKTNGVARILGEHWDRPAIVPDAEIAAIRHVLDTGLPVLEHF